ncbi:MAG: class II glutamine amidotransferase [Candidatus Njordarchaeota archaeon]
MCDFLVACFTREYRAPKTLHRFMIESIRKGDIDGWGIGFFLKNRRCVIVKDVDINARNVDAYKTFDLVSRCIESEIIVAHFRLASKRELYGEKYAHPFKDNFLGQDWIFAHNGFSEAITEYSSRRRIHRDPRFDSPRVFEFIRDRMIEYLQSNPLGSIFYAVKKAIKKLYESYEGTYNFVLSNSNIVFVGLDSRHPYNNRLYLLSREKREYDRAIIITTVRDLTNEDWIEIRVRPGYRGKLLMLSEGELLYNGDL